MTLETVQQAVQELEAQGVVPSVRKVRAITGGSQSDVVRHMQTLRGNGAVVGPGPVPVTAPVRPPGDTAALQEMRAMARGWHDYVQTLHALPPGDQWRFAQYVARMLEKITAYLARGNGEK